MKAKCDSYSCRKRKKGITIVNAQVRQGKEVVACNPCSDKSDPNFFGPGNNKSRIMSKYA